MSTNHAAIERAFGTVMHHVRQSGVDVCIESIVCTSISDRIAVSITCDSGHQGNELADALGLDEWSADEWGAGDRRSGSVAGIRTHVDDVHPDVDPTPVHQWQVTTPWEATATDEQLARRAEQDEVA